MGEGDRTWGGNGSIASGLYAIVMEFHPPHHHDLMNIDVGRVLRKVLTYLVFGRRGRRGHGLVEMPEGRRPGHLGEPQTGGIREILFTSLAYMRLARLSLVGIMQNMFERKP